MERDHCVIACDGELISFGDGSIRFGGCDGIFSELMNWLVLVGMNGFAWMFSNGWSEWLDELGFVGANEWTGLE